MCTIKISVFLFSLFIGITVSAQSKEDKKAIDKALATKKTLIGKDSGLTRFFNESYGYAIFPTVGKGAAVVGGAHGGGTVFQAGKAVGKTTLTQVTVGLQLGGQSYMEVIFFEDERAYENFIEGNLKLSAQVSAVAVTAGASADAKYNDGVAVFTAAKGGLMYEASVGGQKFTFKEWEE